ncbi:MAG: hypothetical protein PHX70_08455 [Clostridium sp.]|nr:hypothetical protein [Clostridium sp.]
MLLALEIIAVLSMVTFMFLSIWGFIVAKQMYGQMRYKNYLMEKMNKNIELILKNSPKNLNEKLNEEKNNSNKSSENDAINAYDFTAHETEKKEA